MGSANIILASYPELKPLKIEDILTSMLNLLRESKAQEFNKMREENLDIIPMPDFSMANLHGVHIAGILVAILTEWELIKYLNHLDNKT